MQLELWTSLPEGIHASPSVQPGSEWARTTTATSGRSLLALCESSGRVGSLARMLLGTSRWGSTKCFLTWRAWATPGKRLLFQLVPSRPLIDETGFGLWPTPRSRMTGRVTRERLNDLNRNLERALAEVGENGLPNPDWLEWLMGYPIGWTELKPSVTLSCPELPKRSSAQ